jgi:acetylglutamate kinase
VNPAAVQDLIDAGRIPVVSTVAPDDDGQVLNVNADTAPPPRSRWLRRGQVHRADRCRRALRELAGSLVLLKELTDDELEEMLPACSPAWCPRWRPACGRSAVASPRPR